MVKHTQTIRWHKLTNYLNVFDHFVGLALKGLTHFRPMFIWHQYCKEYENIFDMIFQFVEIILMLVQKLL